MSQKDFTRRDFLKGTLGAGIAMAGTGLLSGFDVYNAKKLPTAVLGKTGVRIPRIAIGLGSRFCTINDEATSTEMLNYALDNGLYYFDTANFYVDTKNGVISEERVGKVVKYRRKEIFLSTKLSGRNPDDAKREIETSLKRLQTDHLDMLKIHAVQTMDDVAELSKKGGLIDIMLSLKEQKVTRFIGFSGHYDADALTAMASRGDFDVMLIAMNHWASNREQQRQEMAIPVALEKNMGVMLMKVIRPREKNPDLKGADLIRYALSLKGPAGITVGMEKLETVKENIEILRNFKPMNEMEMELYAANLNPFFRHQNLPWMNPGYKDGQWA
jgi:predicted aldo/keto reductase-like oxidoreductase